MRSPGGQARTLLRRGENSTRVPPLEPAAGRGQPAARGTVIRRPRRRRAGLDLSAAARVDADQGSGSQRRLRGAGQTLTQAGRRPSSRPSKAPRRGRIAAFRMRSPGRSRESSRTPPLIEKQACPLLWSTVALNTGQKRRATNSLLDTLRRGLGGATHLSRCASEGQSTVLRLESTCTRNSWARRKASFSISVTKLGLFLGTVHEYVTFPGQIHIHVFIFPYI